MIELLKLPAFIAATVIFGVLVGVVVDGFHPVEVTSTGGHVAVVGFVAAVIFVVVNVIRFVFFRSAAPPKKEGGDGG